MNLDKPITVITLGSLLIGLFVLLSMILIQSFSDIDIGMTAIALIPLIAFGVSFGIFALLIERFINEKINVIYRIIKKGKLQAEQPKEYRISEDGLGQLSIDTAEWAERQKKQITELKEQANYRKEFLGNLAHELKTPLFSIQGYVLTLLEGGLEDKEVNREFLERALTGVDRLSTLLEDLDAITRFENERYDLKISKFDIVELVQETFHQLRHKAKEKQIKFRFAKEYDPILVRADRNKIAQVVTNLISNSISYGNEEGKTTVRFHTLSKDELLVEVADDGVGMDESHFPRLFERFYRVDKSRERNVGGSGLGLAIVKHIIDAHGQSINVRSTEGVGSTFSFTLEKV